MHGTTETSELTVRGETLTVTALSEHFNDHFINANANITSPNPMSCTLDHHVPETAYLKPTDSSEVNQAFMSLKNSKALDIESMQIEPVKHVLDLVCPYLVFIFNLAIESGCFPHKMKRAKCL